MNAPVNLSPVSQALGAAETGVARAAVVGAGSMGAGIAAQFANAGIPVDLLDIPGKDGNRNGPAETGIARQLKAGGFMAPEAAALVRPGNVEDHLDRLAQADWIVEAIIEDLGLKRDLYQRIDAVRRPGTAVTSNTSTIPRAALVQGLGEAFAQDFAISHFFNPPRVMRLLEIVGGPESAPDTLARIRAGGQALLGKTLVDCRDTPGFIANRIGCFWMAVGMLEAMRQELTVEEADAVHAAMGIPRTGVFGLADLVGLDLIPHVWGSLMAALPPEDDLHRFDLPGNALVRRLVAEGRHGRKTGAGFYRRAKDGTREALDLTTGEYRPERPVDGKTLPGVGRDLAALVADEGRFGRYAATVLSTLVDYAATNAPDIAGDVAAVDTAIELGYSWREGPFRLADRAGTAALADVLKAAARPVPALLTAAGSGGFHAEGRALSTDGATRSAPPAPGLLTGAAPILGNPAAQLRDLGDGVACFQMATKMNTFAPEVFDLLEEVIPRAGKDFAALVIGNDDPRAFSAGADLAFILRMVDTGGIEALGAYIGRGQRLFLALKRMPVPVVAAMHGFALGGGCEVALHADAIVAHAELTTGLPETNVGLVPGWGGCTQMLLRAAAGTGIKGPVGVAQQAFDVIQPGTVSSSALGARAMGILRPGDGIVMLRDDLLPAAKRKVLALMPGYATAEPPLIAAGGASAKAGLLAPLSASQRADRISATDLAIADLLATVLTGGDAGPGAFLIEEEIMALELAALLKLAETPQTRARMEHMLRTGKPLRN
ncbi:3-hydroxyacyl-CoA dehydrogenase [Frigidibacter albus]|uniref:enoyl-CoA hydratase n=1 Tax=Frigidibacter albus TaxID=1465486 RepID=A0A6L8VLZ2_9RHOB|nr:3-hydroxyacyl-CoA dehydrogenase/enoyl-CoA hydratase family protein [Frigidibacter albus]MZQ91094.1 3-hydroxyacyl-CoA dehydrogenase [Frigidibacter albus]NBE32979.1 3-hydroxyacyl-CoA dehydrogenase [Frigidibacter albus]GGH62756.1 3-hydroxyacyl-CoA dehydrogenase [Frigidibacter albus]